MTGSAATWSWRHPAGSVPGLLIGSRLAGPVAAVRASGERAGEGGGAIAKAVVVTAP